MAGVTSAAWGGAGGTRTLSDSEETIMREYVVPGLLNLALP